jgi:hypothetical protein
VQFDKRQVISGVVIAGLAGAILFLPAISFIGSTLMPNQPVPASQGVPPLLADAIWARTNGGRATELQPLNPFTIGRTVTCHILAERYEPEARGAQHDECMKLLPGVQAVGYLSTVHMKSEGVWQDPRVPFVQIATMSRITSKWTKAELLNTIAERAEFGAGFIGAEAASRGYFGRSPDQLTLPQAAMVGAFAADARVDPWCDPEEAAARRHRILAEMRDNGAIDEVAFAAADKSELGLSPPPATHRPCKG